MTIEQQLHILLRGVDRTYTAAELKTRLELAASTKRQLRVKLGMDPTAPDLHLGHAVVLRKMRQFQDLGHKAVLIIGDFTAMIGDPTGKKKTRPVLSREQVETNAKTYFEQAGKVIDTSPEKLEIRYNSEWLSTMSFGDTLKLAQQMTVARMLERDTFSERYKAGEAIYIHEFMYPLMQGWDSVKIQADIELGGTDQTFNNLVGRDLQVGEGQLPQIVMIMPILVGTDGVNKMGKSLGNYVGVSDSPREQFGKTMSIPDAAMASWFRLATPLPEERITSLVDPQHMHPRQAKEVLARSIVEQYHGLAAAEAAAAEFKQMFSEHGLPSEIETKTIAASLLTEGKIGILSLIKEVGFATSSSEARRLVEGGGVQFDAQRVTDVKLLVEPADKLLQVGKRRLCKIAVA